MDNPADPHIYISYWCIVEPHWIIHIHIHIHIHIYIYHYYYYYCYYYCYYNIQVPYPYLSIIAERNRRLAMAILAVPGETPADVERGDFSPCVGCKKPMFFWWGLVGFYGGFMVFNGISWWFYVSLMVVSWWFYLVQCGYLVIYHLPN